MFRALSFLLVTLLATACTSPGSGGPGTNSAGDGSPKRVMLTDYRSDLTLVLLDEAHGKASDFYSEKRANANTKVCEGGDLEAMLDYFADHGFELYAQRGFAPLRGSVGAIEVETPEGVRFLTFDADSDRNLIKAFQQCRVAFVQLYDLTIQAQTVTNPGGRAIFKSPAASGHRND